MKNSKFADFFGIKSLEFTPFVAFAEGKIFPKYNIEYGNRLFSCTYEDEIFSDHIYITEIETGFTAKRVFKNRSAETIRLSELGARFSGLNFGLDPKDDYYYHVENPRVFQKMTLAVDCPRTGEGVMESEFDAQAGNKWADPGVIVDRIGACPYQPFPAIVVSNYKTKGGIVHGTLSQDVFYHCYLISHEGSDIVFDVCSPFKDIAYREVAPAETLVDEWYLGKTDRADDVEVVFEEYSHELRKKLPANYGATSINRDNLVWGSWNDGIYRDISEELLLREAKELVENFPNVKWLQLDDGYCTLKGQGAHGLGVPYEGDAGVDHEKFPNGIRSVTDKLRLIGLRPAVWIGGFCPTESKISKERPDLMFEYTSRTTENLVLDVSIPETREYMTKALDEMIHDWGFDGVKHDFWSYAFEVSEDLLKNKNKSGYEWRDWWLKEVRKRISSDGYFQTGCDIVMGNPFLGTHFTNYRYGIDIGSGNWDNLKTNYLWCIACLATHTGDLFVPNSDAVGMFPGLTDTDAEFCVNFVLITRTMVELAGVFSKADKASKRFKMLKKATCNINNGQDVFFAGYDYRAGEAPIPDKLYIKTPHFSTGTSVCTPARTVALFNPSEDARTVIVRAHEMELDPSKSYVLTDVWSGEQFTLAKDLSFKLAPHGSRLLAVSEGAGYQIYDSNIRLENVELWDNKISADTFYGADCTLTLSKSPVGIYFDGEQAEYSENGSVVSFKTDKAGKLEIVF